MTTYYLLRCGSLVSRVVPLPVAYALAGLVGRAAYLLPTRARAAAPGHHPRRLGPPTEARRCAGPQRARSIARLSTTST